MVHHRIIFTAELQEVWLKSFPHFCSAEGIMSRKLTTFAIPCKSILYSYPAKDHSN